MRFAKALGGLVNGLLLVLVVNMLHCRVLKAQNVYFADSLPANFMGMTTCNADNKATIVIVKNLNAVGLTQALAHERTHASQMDSFQGGCRAAQAKYQADPEFRFQMELEAYCVQLTQIPQYEVHLPGLATFMWQTYGQHQTQEDTQARVISACMPASLRGEKNQQGDSRNMTISLFFNKWLFRLLCG